MMLIILIAVFAGSALTVRGDKLDQQIAGILANHALKGAAVIMVGPQYPSPIVRVAGLASSKACPGSSSDVLVNKDTSFMIASASKSFTGVAAAVALEKGFVDLDADISNLLGYDVYNPSTERGIKDIVITLRHLLTHRSSMVTGSPPYGDDKEASYGGGYPGALSGKCPMRSLSAWYKDLLVDQPATSGYGGRDGDGKLNVPNWYKMSLEDDKTATPKEIGGSWMKNVAPGEKENYSNIGTGLVGVLIEQGWKKKAAEDKSVGPAGTFSEFCEKYIFGPAGMKHTAWHQEDLPNKGANVAQHFDNSGTKAKPSWKCMSPYCFADYPSGQLRTSANDIATYLQLMLNKGE